ncbi:IucA/IucC family protein [Roseobacter sp. MH60115]|uniref:IucA/IucC family protein n=1 Tax=Roseobacter sp. MH60115 TaxID=2785324 RepID=UPI0018A338B5|nr:IucA/IucC family protein [Roseobacter sp. MH60115]
MFQPEPTIEAAQGIAHHRVLRQFCEALLYENHPALDVQKSAPGQFAWRIGDHAFRASGWRGAFGRVHLTDGTIHRIAPRGPRPATCEDLLLALDLDTGVREALREDLIRTAHLTDLTRDLVHRHGPRVSLPYSLLETAIDEGHPYHPCFKARSGFSDADHLSYGPEAGARFKLQWLLLDADIVDQNLPSSDTFWQRELGAAHWQALQNKVADTASNRATRAILPVHPWQLKTLHTQPLYQDWCRQGIVKELGALGDHYVASQSVRTLINADAPERAHVKTAMAMRNTSALRTIEPHSVCVAPAVSNWLAAVLDGDPLFGRELKLTLLKEYAGVIAGRATPLAGYLAAIWRQSPEGIGLAADAVLPFNALSLTEADGRPLIDPWVRSFGLEKWLDQLLRITVLPVWHLMVAHGIGLEAHGQNLLLTHEGGWPTGLVARDFHESLEYVPALLSRPDLVPDLGLIDPVYIDAPPDIYHAMASAEALRELVVDTLFIYNLAELSALLQRHYGLPETLFWPRVRLLIDSHVERHELQERQALFDPFRPHIFTESLMTQKLMPASGLCRHRVPNALQPAKGDTHVRPE